MKKHNMRILWCAVSPQVESGYGRCTREIVSRLSKAGYDIVCYGLQDKGLPHITNYRGRNFRMVGSEDLELEQPLMNKLQYHFQTQDRNIIMSQWDSWALPPGFAEQFPTWIPYIPFDAEPVTKNIYTILRNAFRRVTMSHWAESEFAKVGLDTTTIYHGVDTKIYKPLSDQNKKNIRASMGIPVDAFVIGMVGRNYFDRKMFPRAIMIFSEMVHRNNLKDCYLYIHAEKIPREVGAGFNMEALCDLYDISDYVLFPSTMNVPDEDMNLIFNMMDILLSTSGGEGFGMPLLEAQACGIPVVSADNSAQSELVKGRGWLIPCSDHDVRLTAPNHAKWMILDFEPAVGTLEDLYEHREKITEARQKCIDFAVEYDWDKVVEKHWIPFLEKTEKAFMSNAILQSWAKNIKRWKLSGGNQ